MSFEYDFSKAAKGYKSLQWVKMAGAEGFEPSNAEIKTPCLAAWRRPKKTFKYKSIAYHLFMQP